MGPRDEARAVIDRVVSAYNDRDIEALRALYRPDITYWSAIGGTQSGADAVIAHVEHLHATLPDERMRPLAVVTDGDVVVAEFESTGTSPSGSPYSIEFTEVFEIVDGHIASIEVYLDTREVADAMA